MGDRSNAELLAFSMAGLPTAAPAKLSMVEYKNELNVLQYDSMLLPVISAFEYYKFSGDGKFLADNFQTLKNAMAWAEGIAPGGKLASQPGSADWKDVVKRSGKVAYTNVVLYKAFDSMSRIGRLMGEDGGHYADIAANLKNSINAELWLEDAGYYRDSDGVKAFSADGNVPALIWGVAEGARAEKLLERFEYLLDYDPLPFPGLEGDYEGKKVPFWLKLAGMRHYHDRFIWPWQGNMLSIAASRAGKAELALKALGKVGARRQGRHFF
jgi:glycogen debranching enzyme